MRQIGERRHGTMNKTDIQIQVREMDSVDIGDVVRIDELITGKYRPDDWEDRLSYHLRREPDGAKVAELDGEIVGFMLGEVRTGEFGLEEPTGWIAVLGVDPEHQGHQVGRRLAEAMLDYFKSRNVHSVRTLVDDKMGDIAGFFKSLGFEPASLRPFVKRLD